MFLTDLADKLRAYTAPDGSKLTVIEVGGWQYRTYDSNGLSGNVGVLWHHTATASASRYSAGAPTLGMCTNGRSDLAGPLCNIVFGRAGEVYVVAGGQANHAGRGSINGAYENVGNYYLIGIEMESDGVTNDWTGSQKRVAPHLGAALDRAYSGGGSYYQVGHKEYSYDGKIDPSFWDMDDFRTQINRILEGKAARPASARNPATRADKVSTPKIQPYWVVEKGDTLSKIARYYKGEATQAVLEAIARENKMKVSAPLKVGQKILIPSPLVWVVERGDTWEKIAGYYGFDTAYLKSLNKGVGLNAGNVVTIF